MTSTQTATDQNLTLRFARAGEQPELRRLVQLDSADPLPPSPTLVAELDGELVAALSLAGGAAIANPFRRTAEAVALLEARADQLQAPSAPTRRRRFLRSLRPSPARLS